MTKSDDHRVAGNLLCVCNFSSNVGFAWNFIEGLYAKVADHLRTTGVVTFVAYPQLDTSPKPLTGSAAHPVQLDVRFSNTRQFWAVVRFIRAHSVRTLYLTDRPLCSFAYPILRLFGIRRIVVHDHTSGEHRTSGSVKTAVKWLVARLPGVSADVVVAVSDYVRERDLRSTRLPPSRIVRIWNGIPLGNRASNDGSLHRLVNACGGFVISCCCRASVEKGVAHLLRAFSLAEPLLTATGRNVLLVYIGDGPRLSELQTLSESLPAHARVRFLGYCADASELLADADLCVVPSVWQDALPLGVMEPMSHGKAVIATRVGGIPEMINDGETGVLVPPADERALADAIVSLTTHAELRERLGTNARARIAERFDPDRQIASLVNTLAGRIQTKRSE